MLSQTADAHVCQKLKGVSAKGVIGWPLRRVHLSTEKPARDTLKVGFLGDRLSPRSHVSLAQSVFASALWGFSVDRRFHLIGELF